MKRNAEEQAFYDESKRIIAERARGGCEVAIEGVCAGRGTHAHHIVRQGQGGADDPENLLWVCGSGTTGCHGYVHANVKWAKENGLIKSAVQPVRFRQARGLDGGIAPCLLADSHVSAACAGVGPESGSSGTASAASPMHPARGHQSQ